MAKRLTTDDQLALLRTLRALDSSAAHLDQLGVLLRTSRLHGLALKGAADLAEKWDARSLLEALAAAAESLAPNVLGADANKRDPGAEGKQAALRVLVAWEADLPALYVQAAAWVQHAPVMNGSVDVAAECRGLAAIGIAQTMAGGPEQALELLVDLLADPETPARVRAAQALGMWRGTEAVAVLRLKALTGDEQPEVLGEVLAALLRHDPRRQLPFVVRFLHRDEEPHVEAAALALGESHRPEALAPLADAYQRHGGHLVRTSVLMAIALLRHEESLAWLLAKLQTGGPSEASSLLSALRLYRGDEKIVKRIAEVAAKKGPDVAAAFKETFGS